MIAKNLIFQIDAFTDQIFRGNPAAVCLLQKPASAEWMQNMATEMNLSETAFVCLEEGRFRLRWFTPTVEVPLCGHATLATVYALKLATIISVNQKVFFETASGTLTGLVREDEFIELDFPSEPPTEFRIPDSILEACGISSTPIYTGKNRLGWVVDLPTEDEVRKLEPNFEALAKLGKPNVMITARSDSGTQFDFVSRFFAPGFGISEDPVTGAMHCCLGPYWQKILKRDSMRVFQASPRGGKMEVIVKGDRTILAGQAQVVFEGQICNLE